MGNHTDMENHWENAVVWVSGAGSGLGRALSHEAARRGATVVGVDIDGPAADATARHAAVGMQAAVVDVTDAAAVARSISETVGAHGRIDHVFNNAGVGGVAGEVQHFDAKHWDAVIDVNLRGVVNGVAAAYPVMVEQGHGHIVNTASLAGIAALGGLVPYAATKHAVVGLTKSLRIEAADHGVSVSALCPAGIETAIMDTTNPADLADDVPWVPDMRRYLGNIAGIGDADGFARHALDNVARGREIIVYGARARMVAKLAAVAPRMVSMVGGREYRAERERQLAGRVATGT